MCAASCFGSKHPPPLPLTLPMYSNLAWNQQGFRQALGSRGAARTGGDPLSKARPSDTDAERTEYVRGNSSSASAWSFIPEVNVSVAPHGGATTKPRRYVVPKIPSKLRTTTPRGSAAFAGHSPDKENTKTKAVTQTLGNQKSDTDSKRRYWTLTTETLDLRGPPVAVPYFASPTHIGQTRDPNRQCQWVSQNHPICVANAKILRWLYRHPRHASHRRRTVKGTKRHKEGRGQQEGQGFATSHGGAMSHQPESV